MNSSSIKLLIARQAWMALGDMTAETAMNTFIENIRGLMPAFDTYLQSNRADGSGFSTRFIYLYNCNFK